MKSYKLDFPILAQEVYGKPLVYLDNSNTTQKPFCVIDALNEFYEHDNANVHRVVYQLSERATAAFEDARLQVKQSLNAKHEHEIIFTSGTTGSINLVASSLGQSFAPGDEVILSVMEHHSNIIPWQLLRDQKGIVLKIIPINDAGEIDLTVYEALFSKRTKLVSVVHASNVIGTVNPIAKMAAIAHAHQVPILVDGAQAFPHMPVDIQALDCDFYVLSAHKAYAPTGVGILYGKTALLEKMPPYQGGGSMIESVSFEKTTYAKLPAKFEAGTPNVSGVVGFGAALRYLNQIGMQSIYEKELALLAYATDALKTVPGLKIIGDPLQKTGVISFIIDKIHPHDIGTILDREGIAVRVGHHCAMPLMQRYQVPATVRVSFAIYNTKEDVDALIAGLHSVKRLFA